ncbi:RHS repeat-associated core domain-containing protein [Escherichia coli]|uniref:RHS repeat-associated core domain-containing protein n=1 Tax=Escherichia coli TaxID=562 RepID=UPI001081866A|nr:RHS repeat-associated core domain-containing protein [Escherichia coli]TGH93503.1 RHS repeat protein [Escherichia coli]
MSGKPAARQGDMTQYGGPIVQGSAGVRIGAPTGVACSVCPGGMTSGNPVNPLLGAKVLPGETDLALPGPLPFILSRTYSSYRTRTPAPVGVFGPGWKAPSDIRLQLRDDALVLNDNGGRSIHFEPLLPGEAVYSRSESMWLVRGGKAAQPDGHTLAWLWGALPPDIRLSPHLYLATNSAQGPWWILGWSERVPGAEDVLPAPLPPYRVLTGLADRFGRTLTYRREAAGDLAGEITGVTDGAGREFRLVLTTQAQRAEEARTSSLSSSDSSRPLSASPFPDTLPGTEYGPDRGIRLSAVWLMHDPAYPESLPGAPLARYTYTEAGELLAVYDRSNTQVRAFTYDAQHPGRMVAHRYAGRPEMRYRYDDTGRVVEQLNPAGLSYRYQYEQDRITVTDSLNRREVLHTEGGAGLKRVVKKELADGSVTHSGYDAAGRLTAQTDAAGRRTEYGLNVVSGDITDITTPDGRETKFYYNDGNQLTAVVSPDGLESRRAYDEPGRLVSETSRSGDVIRYAYDNPHSELPATTTDATGSTRQMTWSRYGQLLAFTDCSGYQTRYEYDRFGQMTAVHREEGISLYRRYDNRGRLTSVKDAQGRETRYEYNAAGDLTAVITPDGNRSETQYDAWGKAVSTTQGGLTRSMEYDAAGRVISLTNENGSHSVFSYDALEPQVESRYLYDPLGRRTGKRVWRRERDLTGWMSLSRKPEETWYGWDGDRLTTVQTQQTRIQTVYQPGSFTPLLRIETENGEQAKARHRSLAEVLQEDTGVTLPAELAVMLGRLERELRQGSVSEESQQWLAQCGLTAEQMAAQLEAEYIPERKLHLYHCDHRGLPLALISPEGETAWQGEYDEWGNLLGEESAQHLQQSLRLPGQQYDEESGLYYNRNRYYDPLQGRYITQDPIGLRGEWNLYKYPLNPVRFIDSLGLKFHVNGDPSDFNQAVEYLKQDSQMKETIDFLSSSEETINIEYIEGTNVRFNSNNMAIYWNSRASLFCSTELNSKSQSPALGLGHEFAHAQYYLLDKENFMALLSRTDKKYENKEEARVITIIESRAAKTLGECTRGAHSGLPFYRVDGPLQTMKITGTPE